MAFLPSILIRLPRQSSGYERHHEALQQRRTNLLRRLRGLLCQTASSHWYVKQKPLAVGRFRFRPTLSFDVLLYSLFLLSFFLNSCSVLTFLNVKCIINKMRHQLCFENELYLNIDFLSQTTSDGETPCSRDVSTSSMTT